MHHSRSETSRSSALDLLEKIALIGAIGFLLSPALRGIAHRWRLRNPLAAREDAVDESLQDTFPASDPPSGRFVDIPQNRKNGGE